MGACWQGESAWTEELGRCADSPACWGGLMGQSPARGPAMKSYLLSHVQTGDRVWMGVRMGAPHDNGRGTCDPFQFVARPVQFRKQSVCAHACACTSLACRIFSEKKHRMSSFLLERYTLPCACWLQLTAHPVCLWVCAGDL